NLERVQSPATLPRRLDKAVAPFATRRRERDARITRLGRKPRARLGTGELLDEADAELVAGAERPVLGRDAAIRRARGIGRLAFLEARADVVARIRGRGARYDADAEIAEKPIPTVGVASPARLAGRA